MPRRSDVAFDETVDAVDRVVATLDTYATNVVLFRLRDELLQLEPGSWDDALPYPFDGPAYVVSAFNPGCVPQRVAANQDAHGRLRRAFVTAGARVHRAAFEAADGAWAESALIVRDVAEEIVLDVARAFAVPAIVQWDSEFYRILPLVDAPTPGPTRWRLRPQVPGCPMLLTPGPGEECRNPGGGWTGASIRAAAVWQTHQTLLRGVRGCPVFAPTFVPEVAR